MAKTNSAVTNKDFIDIVNSQVIYLFLYKFPWLLLQGLISEFEKENNFL